MTSRNIFSIENQLQVTVSHWRENQKKKRKKGSRNKEIKKKKKKTKRTKQNVTVMQFQPNHRYAIHVWKMVASDVHISLSFIVCFIVFIHGLFHFLVPFNLVVLFIYFHVFSFFHFFMCFHVCSFPEKNITNLNHLHVDPRLSSAEERIKKQSEVTRMAACSMIRRSFSSTKLWQVRTQAL